MPRPTPPGRSLVPAIVLAVLAAAVVSSPVAATWSIQIADEVTGEVAVGSATCVSGIDLLQLTPVVVVGTGAAAAQSVADSGGENRRTIFDGFLAGDSPEQILADLEAQDGLHQNRQYGIVDVPPHPEVTFTGSEAGAYAGGVTGRFGDLVYTIQGNLLTGAPVVERAEQALLRVRGDVPLRLMAAMFAAYRMGGDGRCSCSQFNPTGCGSPPAEFEKSAHVGYMVVARAGDADGGCDAEIGCASGEYYMSLNVPFDGPGDPDPVVQLRGLFLDHRRGWIGRPDHHESTVAFDPGVLPADGVSSATATLSLADWRGDPLTSGGASVSVELAPDSGAQATIGPVTDQGDGSYTFELTAGMVPGTVRLLVAVDDGQGAIQLAPSPSIDLLP